jgi:hypothetical protein
MERMCDLLNIKLTIQMEKTEAVQLQDFVSVHLRAAKVNVRPGERYCHDRLKHKDELPRWLMVIMCTPVKEPGYSDEGE